LYRIALGAAEGLRSGPFQAGASGCGNASGPFPGDSVLPYGNDTGSFGSNSNQQTSDSDSRRRATIVGSRKAAEQSIIFITERPLPVR
jgi:hypothetical protein